MDDTDRQILAELRRDARAPLQFLADAAGVSRATVRARIEKMRARGDIAGFSVVTPADLARPAVRGLMLLGIEGAAADRVTHRLLGMTEVLAVHATNGKWDLVVELGTTTLERLDLVLAEIRRLPGVQSSETNLLLSTRSSGR